MAEVERHIKASFGFQHGSPILVRRRRVLLLARIEGVDCFERDETRKEHLGIVDL